MSRHSTEFMTDVWRPGPTGTTFWKQEEAISGLALAWAPPRAALVYANAPFTNLMQEDVTASLFTPGCAAYAGFSAGGFSNMDVVRAYTAPVGARAFAYSGYVNQLSGADAIDIEPGLAVESDAPAAYRAGIRYFYSSASSAPLVISYLASAGVARDTYKVIAVHCIGEHICGPSTCGYPQADATEWTDTYMGRSLSCTVFDDAFFRAASPVPGTAPDPVPGTAPDPVPGTALDPAHDSATASQ